MAQIRRFGENGDKTGWTYIDIPEDIAQQLFPGNKSTFRVKGLLDRFAFEQVALAPMGDGTFIMPLNAVIRKGIGKREGAMLQVNIERDTRVMPLSPELIECLEDDPDAAAFYKTLSASHQRYFSNWVESAKTQETKAKRLAICLNGLANKMSYGEMIRAHKKIKPS